MSKKKKPAPQPEPTEGIAPMAQPALPPVEPPVEQTVPDVAQPDEEVIDTLRYDPDPTPEPEEPEQAPAPKAEASFPKSLPTWRVSLQGHRCRRLDEKGRAVYDDFMDVQAQTAGDAWDVFKQLNGIVSTIHTPEIGRLE